MARADGGGVEECAGVLVHHLSAAADRPRLARRRPPLHRGELRAGGRGGAQEGIGGSGAVEWHRRGGARGGSCAGGSGRAWEDGFAERRGLGNDAEQGLRFAERDAELAGMMRLLDGCFLSFF